MTSDASVSPVHSGDPQAELRRRASVVVELLRSTYGRQTPVQRLSPTDSLVATILSQHTSDRNSHSAFLRLKRRFRGWREVLEVAPEELSEVIRCAGLANIKAVRIQAALQSVEARFGAPDLDFLKTTDMHDAREILLSLPGVGPKTAACVLLFACGQPALPVDTHVHRVTKRLGLIGPRDSADKAHDVLEALIPAEDVYDFHVNVIAHGRAVCQARIPKCGECALRTHCNFYHLLP